jgi:hypothetical protein
MTTFSTADQTRLRGHKHTLRAVLNAVPLVTVATAQINQSAFSYPLAQLTVDNTSADWLTKVKAGMAFSIGTAPGGSDVTWGVVRRTPAASTFYMDAKSVGDPGYARAIHTPLADNYYITIYKHRPPWGIYSSIRSGVFYKNWDTAYSGQTASPEPIIRIGKHRADFVDSDSGLATFTFTADAYTWNKTVSSYAWDVDGGTITVGTSSTQSITVTFPVGFYVVTCTVVDSAGKTRTAYRYVFANSRDRSSPYSPFSYRHRCRFTRDTQDFNGREMSIDILGDLDTNEIYPGQAMLLTEVARYGNHGIEPLDDETGLVTNFIGYIPSKSIDVSRKFKLTSIPLESPITAAKGVPSAVQELTESPAPANWTQCTKILSNPVGAAYYCMAYHAPFMIDGHDLEFDTYLLNLRFLGHQYGSRDIQSQLSGLAERFLGNIGCRSDGTIRMVRNPMYITNAFRSENDVKWQWDKRDFTNQYQRETAWRMEYGTVYGYAFSYSGEPEGTPYASIAPGRAAAQGVGQDEMTPFIVISADGQPEANRITGHHFAYVDNATPSLVLDAFRNLDIAEPCNMDEWHQSDLLARYDPEGVGFSDRGIAVRVTRNWSDKGSTLKHISVELLPETFGQPGVTLPVNRGGADNFYLDEWNPYQEDHYEPPMPDLGLNIPIMLAGNSAGLMGRSQSFDEPNVQWEKQ